MQIRRQEILTGLLVIVTLGVTVFVILRLGAPGVFTPLKTFYVILDNVAGLKPGAPVLLAGRRIGQVTELHSPLPMNERPPDHKNYEVLITLRVNSSAEIYKTVDVRMAQPSLLGDSVIDFTSGIQSSGLAPDGTTFIGKRDPGIAESVNTVLAQIGPVAKSAEAALIEVKETAENLKRITSKGSEFDLAMTGFREVGDNFAAMTAEGGALRTSVQNIETLTSDLSVVTTRLADDDTVSKTLESFQSVANRYEGVGDELEGVALTLRNTIRGLDPELQAILVNAEQMTDTLKRQPWRLIWPTTKKYPEATQEIPLRPIPASAPAVRWRNSANCM